MMLLTCAATGGLGSAVWHNQLDKGGEVLAWSDK